MLWIEAADAEALAARLAKDVAAALAAAVDHRGRAVLVVSGGSTPVPFFAALAAEPLPWGNVVVTLADERWVPSDDAASNEALVRRLLLRGPAAAASFVPLKTPAPTPERGQREAETRLAALPRPFDVAILGLGNDGHFASLFPGAPELAQGLDTTNPFLCLAVNPPAAPHARLSLTLAALLPTRLLALHLVGPDKRAVLDRAQTSGPDAELPIRALLRQAPGLRVYWAA